jgi:Fe-S cluster assembly protein SufD
MRTGFPTTRDEDWRFTPVAPIARTGWRLDPGGGPEVARVTPAQLEPFRFGEPGWYTLVFVDGRFAPSLSHRPALPEGVTVAPLAEATEADATAEFATPFAALNAAFAEEGLRIQVAPGRELPDPIHLLFVSTGSTPDLALQVRTEIEVGAGARAQFIESYAGLGGKGASFSNVVTRVAVEAGAWVEHTRIQRESGKAYHIGLTEIVQERDSHYRSFSLAAGGAIARHDLRTRLAGENAEALLYGLYLGREDQLVDNHTTIFHDQPHCRSWEVYKGILEDASHAVFNGKVLVKPEAQRTDAKQTNRNLLLSDRARVDTKPQLEIFADDVKCTHGATVGRIDESAFFYLQSRGIPREQAGQILTWAFAAEVVNEVAAPAVRAALGALVADRLGVEAGGL